VGPTDAVGLQIFDYVYAWLQSQSKHTNYRTDVQMKISHEFDKDCFNILFASMPDAPLENLSKYQLVILDNADEQLEVSTGAIYDAFVAHDHVYLLANSYLSASHALNGRVIPTIFDNWKFKQYNLMPSYPQYYDLKIDQPVKKSPLTFINGRNSAWRWHFVQRLNHYLPGVAVRSEMTEKDKIVEIGESYFESSQDAEFRCWLNDQYIAVTLENAQTQALYYYHDRAVQCGIDNRYGVVPAGYFLIDDYFNHHVIVYPESSWLNDQLNVTEKAIKCFYARCFPAPLSGSGVNQLYNQLGFYTAWNLLPAEHQAFDHNKNHLERYEQMAQAMAWLYEHPEVFETQQAQDMIQHNFMHVLTWKSVMPGIEALWTAIQSRQP
jgi:hypothetical protein